MTWLLWLFDDDRTPGGRLCETWRDDGMVPRSFFWIAEPEATVFPDHCEATTAPELGGHDQ